MIAQPTATGSDSADSDGRERNERRKMIANMEQQYAAGREIRFHSTRGAPPAPPHYPHTADSEHGPPLSENDHVNDLAKNGQGRPRSVPAKRDESVERGK
jgi:hypothetical protein